MATLRLAVSLALLLALGVQGQRRSDTMVCPEPPAGYAFFPLTDVTGRTLPDPAGTNLVGYHDGSSLTQAQIVQQLAAACDSYSYTGTGNSTKDFIFCNAFTTFGVLKSVSRVPRVLKMDFTTSNSASSGIDVCDGTYVAIDYNVTEYTGKTGSGFVAARIPTGLEDDLDTSLLLAAEENARKSERKWRRMKGLANRLEAQLRADGNQKDKDGKFPMDKIKAAADKLNIPLGYTDPTDPFNSYDVDDLNACFAAPPTYYSTGDAALTTQDLNPFKFVSSVKGQGGCGACTTYAAIAAAESAAARAHNEEIVNINYSEQWHFFCNPFSKRTCTNGWNVEDAVNRVLNNNRMWNETCYYWFPSARAGTSAGQLCYQTPGCATSTTVRSNGDFVVSVYNPWEVPKVKDFLAKGMGSIVTQMNVYNDFYSVTKTSGIYRANPASGFVSAHAINVVGFDDVHGYWMVKNSWGTTWGEYGYVRIAYGTAGIFGSKSYGVAFVRNAILNTTPSPPPYPGNENWCGDGYCQAANAQSTYSETCATCPRDCGRCPTCGNGVCDVGEDSCTCPGDCAGSQGPCCGDGVCSTGESCTSCGLDCACVAKAGNECNNDGICNLNAGEDCKSCPSDCGDCKGPNCGDGKCTLSGIGKKGYREDCLQCQSDCGVCSGITVSAYCGDNICQDGTLGTVNRNESFTTCPRDCSRGRINNNIRFNGGGQAGAFDDFFKKPQFTGNRTCDKTKVSQCPSTFEVMPLPPDPSPPSPPPSPPPPSPPKKTRRPRKRPPPKKRSPPPKKKRSPPPKRRNAVAADDEGGL